MARSSLVILFSLFLLISCGADPEKEEIAEVVEEVKPKIIEEFGYVLNNWGMPGETGPAGRGASNLPTTVGGFPSREAFVARYEELTGRDAGAIDYYRAFQYWRLAAIVEGVLSRYLKGVMGDPDADTSGFRISVDRLADEALRLIRKLD